MKRNDTGEFCVLYVEPSDERSTLFNAVVGQHKPIVVLLSEQARVMQRPDDYAALKKLKRQHDVPIHFVISESNRGRRIMHVATRSGFAVYNSMDALLQEQQHRRIAHSTHSAHPAHPAHPAHLTHSTQQLARDAHVQSPTSQNMARSSQVGVSTFALRDTAPLHPVTPGTPVTPTPALSQDYAEYVRQYEYEDIEDIEDEPTHPPVAHSIQSRQINQTHQTHQGRQRAQTGQGVPPMSARRTRDLSPEVIDAMLETQDAREMGVASGASSATPATPAMPVTPTPVVPPVHTQTQRRRNRFPAILIVLTLIMLIAAGLGYALLLYHPLATPPVIVGHLRFLSSEQLSENSSQGIDDELQLDLSNVSPPASQKSYYAWLLTDQSQGDGQALLLGVVPVHAGSIHFFYPGDAQHTNLLVTMSRLLVTEEDATVTPIAPSPDDSTWRYYGAFSTTPVKGTDTQGNATSFSYLDHLRHLLASDPMLNSMELPGGLSNWLYRNTGKILEWTGSMRENWQETSDAGFLQRQTIRTLAYLDGLSYVRNDVPASMPLGINDRLARVGILEVNGPTQEPPAYLDHVVTHLNGLLQASSTSGVANEQLRKNVAAIIDALSNVRLWLSKVRQDGQQLLRMSTTQLHQPQTLSLLNDMIANATAAYAGQPDPSTGEMYQGVTWIHNQLQTLATLDMLRYDPSNSNVQMIQYMRHKAMNVQRGEA